jgi:hypothetical protein
MQESVTNMKDTPLPMRLLSEAAAAGIVPLGTYTSLDGTLQISLSGRADVSYSKLKDTSLDLSGLKSVEFENGTKTLILGFASDRTIRLRRGLALDIPTGVKSKESPTVSEPSQTSGLPSSRQVGGSHYKDMAIQPSQFIIKNNIPWYEGNAIKYLCRHSRKNGIADLEKAKHYVELAIEHYYGK